MSHLHDLPYPVFKVTLDEACLLLGLRKTIRTYGCTNLCSSKARLQETLSRKERNGLDKLKDKWMAPLKGFAVLSNYQNYYPEASKRRIIWINKILKHNGYA